MGLLVRLAALLLYLASHNWKGEQWEYEVIAQNMLNGQGFVVERYNATYHALVPPLFPFICFVLHLIGGNSAWYQALYYTYHIGLGLGIIWLTYRLALRWFGPATAILAGLFVALEPGLVTYQSYKMEVVTLATFLLLAGVALFQRLRTTCNPRTAVALGLVIGLGLLTRLDLLIVYGLLGAWLVTEHSWSRGLVKPAILAFVVSILLISPWIVRNYLILDRLIFISSNSGEWLWLGNNANSIGTPVGLDGRGVWESAPESFKRSVMQSSNELEISAIFMKEAMHYIANDPWRYSRMAVKKLWYFWWFTPTFGWQYQHIPSAWQVAYKILHAALLVLALFGIWTALLRKTQESHQAVMDILTVSLLLAVLHSLTYVEGRHRLLIEPLLLILSATGAQTIWRALPGEKNKDGGSASGARLVRDP